VWGEDTDSHGPGLQRDATVPWVLWRVEVHAVSSSCVRERLPSASLPLGYAEGEASIMSSGLELTVASVRSCLAPAAGAPEARR
jgi:hypothetical protein